jgi:hypothetical protein
VASKSLQQEPEKAEVIEELLETVDGTLDRVKVLYEQYFLGIQKQPPTHLHTEIERKLRDLAQMQIRNTALRYRFATLQQKFGAYNAYWRRTLRQIENGTYARNLSKVGRQAARTGADIPPEILAAMPKRMQDQVRRDREAALALAARRAGAGGGDEDVLTLEPDEPSDPAPDRGRVLRPQGPHVLDEGDADLDLEAFFASLTTEPAEPARPAPVAVAPPARPATPVAAPPPVPSAAPAAVPPVAAAPVRASSLGGGQRPSSPTIPAPVPVTRPDAAAVSARSTAVIPPVTQPGRIATQPLPVAPRPPAQATAQPQRPDPGQPKRPDPGQPQHPPAARGSTTAAPSQVTRPNPVVAGTSSRIPVTDVETLAGPFPREPRPAPSHATVAPPGSRVPPPLAAKPPVGVKPAARPQPQPMPAGVRPPPGMTDADVNVLYAKYVKAKEMVGEAAGPGAYGKLLKTINAQAPKIMEQYKAKGVDFTVVIKDNQVVIRAKPKP